MPPADLHAAFFARIADSAVVCRLFDYLPDVFFFIKDLDSRLIAANSAVLSRLGVKSHAEIAGRRDEEFFPVAIARGFRHDDVCVFTTGKPLENRVEVWYDEQRNLDWFVTTKEPLHDSQGNVIGLMGITQRMATVGDHGPTPVITRAVSFIRSNLVAGVTPAEIAGHCDISERSLYRLVKQHLGVTPHNLILRIRIQKAAERLIRTNDSILSIALAHGFCDQSTFTHHFRIRIGQTPRQFRLRHQSGPGVRA